MPSLSHPTAHTLTSMSQTKLNHRGHQLKHPLLSVQYIIDQWQTVAAWTGFCETLNIPYSNFAVRTAKPNLLRPSTYALFYRTGWNIPLCLESVPQCNPAMRPSQLVPSLASRNLSLTTARAPKWLINVNSGLLVGSSRTNSVSSRVFAMHGATRTSFSRTNIRHTFPLSPLPPSRQGSPRLCFTT
jgi:hypothetical protein